MSLRAAAARGFGIIAVLKVITVALGRISALVLPLLLLPEDFGLFGIAALFLALVTLLSEFGLSTELIQRKEGFQEALGVGFALRLLLSGVMVVVLILLASPIAYLYDDLRLHLLIVVLSLTVLLNALTFVPRVVATRKLDFKRAAVPDHIGKSVTPLASIGLALLGLHYWSLAFGLLLGAVAGILAYVFLAPWKPNIRWRRPLAGELLAFGGMVTATRFAILVAHGLDNLLIGYFLGLGPLGFYLIAYTWAVQVPANLSSTFGSVSFPVFSRIRDNRERLRRSYIESVRLYALAVIVLAMGVVIFARPFVAGVFGTTWLPAIAPMQILALSGFLIGLAGLAFSALYALRNPRSVLYASIAEVAVVLIAMPPAIQIAGLLGASLVSVAAAFLLFALAQRAVSKSLRVGWAEIAQHLVDPTAASLVSAIAVLILGAFLEASLLTLVVSSLVFVLVYVAAMTALTRGNFIRELRELWALVFRRAPAGPMEEVKQFEGRL